MPPWCIAAMTDADIDQVIDIELSSFKTPWKRNDYEAELLYRDSYNFIVTPVSTRHNSQILAYITYRIIEQEMHIFKIAVSPKWRHQGVATWLLGNAMNMAGKTGTEAAYLEVRCSNNAAIKFYDKLGFNIMGKRQNYYQRDREDAFFMIKSLQDR